MSHRKKNIQILISFAVFYFVGIGILMVEGTRHEEQEAQKEAAQELGASVVWYKKTGDENLAEFFTKKDIEKLIAEKQKLQTRADIFTADGEIERAKNTYNRIISIDEQITLALNSYNQN